jgi:non-canonical (house-cleaning) NTP pyrophosphatase
VEGANFGIGLEGGVETLDGIMYLSGWVAIVDENEMIGLGSAGHVEMPSDIAKELENGAELGNLMAKIHERDVRNNDGTFGILTDGYISRSEAFEYALTCAFTKHISAAHE